MGRVLKWRLSWLSMVWNLSLRLSKVVGKTIPSMLAMMLFWLSRLQMTVVSLKKWKSLQEPTWMTMPWTEISLVVASMEQVILHRLREISQQRVTILQPSQRPFIWKMTFTIPSETHGNVMLLLSTMHQIWTVQMVWVRFGLPKGVSLIVHQVWRQQTLFRWRV